MSAPRPRHAALRIAAGSLVALTAVLAACEAKMPTSVDVNNMTAASAERAATAAGFVRADDSLRTYYINGYRAGAAAARALPASQIAAVRVQRDTAHGSQGSMWITTVAADSAAAAGEKKHATFHAVTVDPSRFAGLILVDGKRVDMEAMRQLPPNSIASIDVIKGAHAAELYPNDPAAAHGVIQIRTKQDAH